MEKVFGPDRRCSRLRFRPLTESSIAAPPVEGRSGTKSEGLYGLAHSTGSVGGWSRMPVRAPVTEPDAASSDAAEGKTSDAKFLPVSFSWRSRPRIGESGVGSDVGPICSSGSHAAPYRVRLAIRWAGLSRPFSCLSRTAFPHVRNSLGRRTNDPDPR